MNNKKITKIEPQKKNPERLNVYLDGEFAFGISRFTAIWIKPGDELSDERIQTLLKEDEKERALQSALHFIGYKSRTVQEVKKKLLSLEFSQPVIDQIITELIEKNYLNDLDYAKQWVELRSLSKPRSKKMIAYELANRGIEERKVAEALEDAPDDEIQAMILSRKYMQRFSNLPNDAFRKKIIGLLSRKAFPYSVINQTLDTLLKIRNNETEIEE